ncbi:hypothetical protein XAC217_830046 [Xanthomonas citri pv. citri]|nr:hypothetical protein XAC1083_760043 [Xanthomonas citri pv. citri]CEE86564.1 hypothetical protein XACLC80_950003 [Xanthomonas citri pv. citri]CEF47285.1 hypothetical protein XAC217_830046 [Xanthomonas citri pv. citri]
MRADGLTPASRATFASSGTLPLGKRWGVLVFNRSNASLKLFSALGLRGILVLAYLNRGAHGAFLHSKRIVKWLAWRRIPHS